MRVYVYNSAACESNHKKTWYANIIFLTWSEYYKKLRNMNEKQNKVKLYYEFGLANLNRDFFWVTML